MPEWKHEIARRLEPLGLPPLRDNEIAEELAQHLEDRYQDLLAQGRSEDDAVAGAWREIEASDAFRREVARLERPAPLELPPPGAPRRGPRLATLWEDLRYTARSLRRSPGFSFTVIVAIALSIGPITAIVSVGNWLLWRPPPGVSKSGELGLVWFGRWNPRGGLSVSGVSSHNLADISARGRSFTAIAGVLESTTSLSVADGLPELIGMANVTVSFFDTLGVRLRAGRTFRPDEDRGPFGAPVAVIGETLARTTFGSPEQAIGKPLTINSRPFTVIGVAPAVFEGISHEGGIELWLTVATIPHIHHDKQGWPDRRGDGFMYQFVVRAAPGATFAEIETELNMLALQLAGEYPQENSAFEVVKARAYPGLGLPPLTRPRTRTMVNTMLAVGALLLLLGCANVANLLVFRTSRRAHEIAVRKALGASRARLMQLQLLESWLLAVIGAAAGLVLALFLKQLMQQLLFPRPPGLTFNVPIDMRVLGLTLLAALGTGTISAIAPAWLAARGQVAPSLVRGTRTLTRSPKLRTSLAVLQLALSLTLLVGALLLVTTLRNLRGIGLGFDPAGVTVVGVDLGQHGYDNARSTGYHREVLAALEANREFQAVTLAARAPFGSSSSIEILPPDEDSSRPLRVRANGVTQNYFRVVATPIVRGRPFSADEALGSDGAEPTPVIVNETLAIRLFGTIDVIGRNLTFAKTFRRPPRELPIVGVAKDSRGWYDRIGAPEPFLYQPLGRYQYSATRAEYLIKSDLPVRRVGETAAAIAARTDGAVPLMAAHALTDSIDRSLSEERLFAWMLSLLAGLGFVLASLGVYGLVAQTTTERRREFGIRIAIGAGRRDIVRLVARYALVVSSIGVALGLGLAFYATRLVQSMLFGVTRFEPMVYAAAVVTLVAVVAFACIPPALRAIRVQPVEVLRAE
ncbi:MAG TPA: ADOP family duplicated permease [Vicinamibacterales bacterium]|nr:ADOP family duplicated permease [Vicinamibacterales bacterium]